MEMRIPASERTSQKLNELLTQGIAEGDARSELIKLPVRKIVEGALEAEVAEGGGARVLRERRGAGRRLSQWVPAEPPAHGGGRDRVRRASGRRSYRAVRVAGARGLTGRTAELEQLGRDVRPRAECARYRSGLPRCARRECAEPHCRQPGDRAAVAGVRSLRRPRPQRIRHRLLLRRWRRRASARRAAPRGGALRLGHHRGRPEGPPAPGAGHEGGHGQLHGLLRGSQTPRPGRPAPRRDRRGAGPDSCARS